MFLLLCPLWRDFLYVSISNTCDTSSWTFLSPVDSLNYCVFLIAFIMMVRGFFSSSFFHLQIEFYRTFAHTHTSRCSLVRMVVVCIIQSDHEILNIFLDVRFLFPPAFLPLQLFITHFDVNQ